MRTFGTEIMGMGMDERVLAKSKLGALLVFFLAFLSAQPVKLTDVNIAPCLVRTGANKLHASRLIGVMRKPIYGGSRD